jgi:hypothetical protein
MDLLIILKWTTPKMVDANIQLNTADYNSTHLAPPIITVMIDMFLAGGSNKDAKEKEKYYYLFKWIANRIYYFLDCSICLCSIDASC